ncbi:HSF-type DNA-binding protein [Nitzschia inconspicua]|uniref:HSF-type DNA-binding protein n=1 Tax=Nitzschia inconspicua TaxID=303405 RepID=A0A9K3KSS4_9STRA|nr:HSF-type DNA-binding protein [Nitzschia inconspicua]
MNSNNINTSDFSFTGPVAAAKNRTAKNRTIAKSKEDTPPIVRTSDVVVAPPPMKIIKGKTCLTKKKKIFPKQAVHKGRVEAKVSFLSASSKREAKPFVLPTGNRIYSKSYTFPYKLYDLLIDSETNGYDDIISFTEEGDEFAIHNHMQFASELLPQYFGHDKLRSFDRQMSYWGFKRSNQVQNSETGGVMWRHDFFKKGQRSLLMHLKRAVEKSDKSSKRASNGRHYTQSVAAPPNKKMRVSKHLLITPKKEVNVGNSPPAVVAVLSTPTRPSKTSSKSRFKKHTPRTVSPFDGVLAEATFKHKPAVSVPRRVSNPSTTECVSTQGDSAAIDDSLPSVPMETTFEKINKALDLAHTQHYNDIITGDVSVGDPFEGSRFHLVDEDMDESDVASLLSLEDPDNDYLIDLSSYEEDDIIPFLPHDELNSVLDEFDCSQDISPFFLQDEMIIPTNCSVEMVDVPNPPLEQDPTPFDTSDVFVVAEV